MKKYINTICIALIFIICLGIFPINAYDISDNIMQEEHARLASIEWFNTNYGKFYHLKNIYTEVFHHFKTDLSVKYYVAIRCETMLKATSVNELPYVQGMNQVLTAKSTNNMQANAITSYIDELKEYIDIYTTLAIDIIVEVNQQTSAVTLYYQDGNSTILCPVSVLSLDSNAMKQDGISDANALINKVNLLSTKGYSNYDRIAARDYALSWSSNVTSCVCGLSSCIPKYDNSYWNTNYSGYAHTDCTNFVSQCMYAGDLPTDTTWYIGSSTWRVGLTCRNYMVQAGYWDTSTFAAANAGNIIRWTDGSNHLGLITLNDTVTHRYTGHSRDRLNYVFDDSIYFPCEYYTIKTN